MVKKAEKTHTHTEIHIEGLKGDLDHAHKVHATPPACPLAGCLADGLADWPANQPTTPELPG